MEYIESLGYGEEELPEVPTLDEETVEDIYDITVNDDDSRTMTLSAIDLDE